MGENNFRLEAAPIFGFLGLGLIHFIPRVISGSGPIFPAWLNLRIMVLLEEHQKVHSAIRKEGQTNNKHVTKTATRGQGSASSASKSNYDAPSPVPSPQPPPHFDEDGHSDIPRG